MAARATGQTHPMAVTAPAGARRTAGDRELIALLAMVTALTALGIDLMLPAFDDIRADLGMATDATAVTGLVTAYFVGLGVGTIGYGPLADRYGRRPAMRLGLTIYVVGALVASLMPTLPLLMAARFLWGFGAAGPRVVALAVVRDRFEGEAMSKTMSTLMAIFILVPIVAPALGVGLLTIVEWRWLFVFCALWACVLAVWVRRLPETLTEANRIPDLGLGRVRRAMATVVATPSTRAHAVAITALYGVFASYLGSAEAIVDRTFDAGDAFPLIFGGVAAVLGVAALTNGRIIDRVGIEAMVARALPVYVAGGVAFLVLAMITDGRPPLAAYLVVISVILAAHALLLPNLNTLAMAPMAAIAGTASSVLGAFQLSIGALLGGVLDRFFDGTITPLAIGFVLSGAVVSASAVRARAATR